MMRPINNASVPLILLGGTLCDERLWQPVLEQLDVSDARRFTLQADDSSTAAAERLLAQLPPRFCLAGFSLGAIVALEMQAIAPERIAGLALISVNPLADKAENAAGRRQAVEHARAVGFAAFITQQLWPRYVARRRQDETPLRQQIIAMADACGHDVFCRQTEIAIGRGDRRADLSRLRVPILLLSGEEDPICTAQHHRAALLAAPSARWQELPCVGHFVPLEAARETATALHSWINEVLVCDSIR
ncbi:alpha/beta fold hydrolase [Raoultella terrigena]|uniref:alpha/beta fold hydrolase n=1 Tax=Raoultella terrigena TaxID=577 RepID=UPI001330DB36|nr:alpha/beta hydrolase [Raoultella terrigena]